MSASNLGSFDQQPREVVFYTFDYECWLDSDLPELLDPGVPALVIAPVTTPALVVVAEVVGTMKVRLSVSGGKDQSQYKIDVTVLTDAGQIKENEIDIRVVDN